MNIEDEIGRMVTAGVSPPAAPEPSRPVSRYDFVKLGEEIAVGMEQAAEAQVQAAQEALERTRQDAEKLAAALIEVAEGRVKQAQEMLERLRDPAAGLREHITKVDRELASLNDRLKAFGEKILEGHREFNGNAKD
jgi:cell division septum initiation protein DivIVA